jgi:MFS family permease
MHSKSKNTENSMPAFTPNVILAILVMGIATPINGIGDGWGYIEVYIASYLYSFNDSITTGKVHILFLIMELSLVIGAWIFEPMSSRLGYRETLSLMLVLMATGMIICSISTTIWGFIIPAVLFGIATGLRCLTCTFFMVELMPDNYALAVGLSNLGGSLSLLYWGWVPLLVANPNNDLADIEIREHSRTAYYFGEAVTSRVPYLFQVMTMIAILAVF